MGCNLHELWDTKLNCIISLCALGLFSTCFMHIYTLWSSAQKNLRANHLNNCI